jgi:hypothetical protein
MKLPPSQTEFNLLVVLWSQIWDVGFKGLSVVGWQAALNLQVPPEHSKEVSDCKQLIKTLIMGMKTLVWSITHFNATQLQPQAPGAATPGGPKGMREEEVCQSVTETAHSRCI